MIALVDVDYRESGAVAAGLILHNWEDETPTAEWVEQIEQVESYQPGQFYRRELPCLLAVLEKSPHKPELIVVDGYVWLADERRPGLGAYLYEALGRTTPVVGVAKTRFLSAVLAREVVRGDSVRPLYVTAVGIDAEVAAQCVRRMHGPNRLPTALKRVDQLCREG